MPMRSLRVFPLIFLLALPISCKSLEPPPPVGERGEFTDSRTGAKRQSLLLESGGRFATIARLTIIRTKPGTGPQTYALGMQYMLPSDVKVSELYVSVDGAQMTLPGTSRLIGVETTASSDIGSLYRFAGEYQMNQIQAQTMSESTSVSITAIASDGTRVGHVKLSTFARQELRNFIDESR